MKNKSNAPFFVLMLLLLFAYPVHASNIVQIAVGPWKTSFFLDDEGYVWAFKKPESFEEPIRLPNLEHIKKIAPFIAVDANGEVFTWSLNPIRTRMDRDGYTEEAVYNTPQKVKGLQGVTLVASDTDRYFVAVIGKREIVDWEAKPGKSKDKSRLGVMTNGSIRKIFSRPGIKAVAAHWMPEVTPINNNIVTPSSSSLVALFDDGDVIGWGIDSAGMHMHNENTERLLTKSPGATGVLMNFSHTVVLPANGTPQFWGKCGWYGSKAAIARNIMGMDGNVADVAAMALAQGDDNIKKDVFMKRDGSVWIATAPAPEGASSENCPQASEREQPRKISDDGVVAIQVATDGEVVLVLDYNHELWGAPYSSYSKYQFSKVKINLTNGGLTK